MCPTHEARSSASRFANAPEKNPLARAEISILLQTHFANKCARNGMKTFRARAKLYWGEKLRAAATARLEKIRENQA